MACWHGWRRPAPPAERDRKSTRLNSSHGYISYAVSLYRKSTRLNSSHGYISYAVFCLKKKKTPPPVESAHDGARMKPRTGLSLVRSRVTQAADCRIWTP